MLRNLKYRFDASESVRKFKRYFDGNFSYRKFFLLIFCVGVILLYLGPSILRWMFTSPQPEKGKYTY